MDDKEPFIGLADFLVRHATPDDSAFLTSRKIFIAYHAYISRKHPDIMVSMDFHRFCSYLEHLASQFQYGSKVLGKSQTVGYQIRFKSLRKLQKAKQGGNAEKKIKLKIRDINENICCKLCCGYLIDASTITECLHTFCRSCIVQYFQKNRNCPVCDVMIHETAPLSFAKPDMVLQDIVCKLLPGLESTEKRRKLEYERINPSSQHAGSYAMTPVQSDSQFKPVQFILEWVGLQNCTLMAKQIPHKYIRVSGKATVGHVAQFVLQKLENIGSDLEPTVQCDIKSGGVVLPPALCLEQIEKNELNFEMRKDWILLQYDIKSLDEK